MNFESGGGTERVTSVIANEVASKNFDVRIISCQHGKFCKFEINKSIKLHSLNGEKYKSSILRKIYVEKELIKYVKKEQIDIMIAVDVALYLYLIPLQMKKLCKCIAWEHFNYYINPNRMVKYARKLVAEYADCVVVLGKNDFNNYLTHYKHCKNVKYIYNPVTIDVDELSPLKSKRAVAIGRLNSQKGFDMLIKAWAIIEKQVPDWKLDIYGQGTLQNELKKQIDESNLHNVRLRGFTNDVNKVYLDSSLFFLSSRYEGFGLVLLEAMASGLPAVSFRCKEGPAEIIDNGVNGFLVEEGNIQQFADCAIKLMKNEELLKQFASKTQKDLGRFNIDTITNQWINLLNSL